MNASTTMPLLQASPASRASVSLRRRADAEHQQIDRLAPPSTLSATSRRPSASNPPAATSSCTSDAGGAMRREHVRRKLGRHRAHQQARRRLEHGHFLAERTRAGRDLQADEAAAEHGDVMRRRELRAQPPGIVRAAQRRDVRRARPAGAAAAAPARRWRARAARSRAACRSAARHVALALDRAPLRRPMHGHAGIGEPRLGAVRLQLLVGILQEGLRQRRALVRQMRFVAHQVHARAEPRFGQPGTQLRGCMAAADDDDFSGFAHRPLLHASVRRGLRQDPNHCRARRTPFAY